MKDKRVLIISPEVVPYLPQTDQAINSFKIPKSINDNGGQIRIFMPRYGLINERRHQLHEVIRLSGMNLVINDMDTPLIIKVASIPKERIQVYFIDNEDYFKRRAILRDKNGKLFADNDERMIFFTKGVIETVKKLNWAPDIIHLQGWFTSLFPLYLKTYFKDDGIFHDSKIISSIYAKDFNGVISKSFKKKVAFDDIEENQILDLKNANYLNLTKLTIEHSDAFVFHSQNIDKEIIEEVKKTKKPYMLYHQTQESNSYVAFYKKNLI
ncbi:MAG: glycogen synthase [Flavobacteriaceae bacterium]|nr:glycogen synthase [Flavobacteriaceae bacterium]|tara:strand:+ start:23820 stop:24623 length:804 start_codon:yes stop_codon:yes gene_type:complete